MTRCIMKDSNTLCPESPSGRRIVFVKIKRTMIDPQNAKISMVKVKRGSNRSTFNLFTKA